MGINLKKILDKAGDVAEVAGTFTGNPYLKLGGQVIGALVDDDEETTQYLEHMTEEQLAELNLSLAKVMKEKIKN